MEKASEDEEEYSCGSSESNVDFDMNFSELVSKKEKIIRIKYYWYLALKKAIGASIIIRKLHDQNQKIFL